MRTRYDIEYDLQKLQNKRKMYLSALKEALNSDKQEERYINDIIQELSSANGLILTNKIALMEVSNENRV